MNSVQESKNELDAAIRYAENAISSAKQTIESMEFRQEMAQKNYQEQTGREQALEQEVVELTKQVKELEAKVQGQYDDIVQLERDLTVKTSQAEAWKKKYYDFKEALVQAGDPRVVEGVSGVIMNKPTMPVIPKDVAIAIFREGTLFGVEAACDEIQGETINISESNYVGDFSITFERDIHLDDELDLDWMRDKVGQYNEEFVVGALKGLCALKEFECRIHGVDDNTIDLTKKND